MCLHIFKRDFPSLKWQKYVTGEGLILVGHCNNMVVVISPNMEGIWIEGKFILVISRYLCFDIPIVGVVLVELKPFLEDQISFDDFKRIISHEYLAESFY